MLQSHRNKKYPCSKSDEQWDVSTFKAATSIQKSGEVESTSTRLSLII